MFSTAVCWCFTPADYSLPPTAIRNAASLEVFAIGTVTLGGTIKAADTVTVTITTTDANGTATRYTPYLYTVLKTDTLDDVLSALIKLINIPGDPNVTAQPNFSTETIFLTAKTGRFGNGARRSVIPPLFPPARSSLLPLPAPRFRSISRMPRKSPPDR